jgi:hypothetical protein
MFASEKTIFVQAWRSRHGKGCLSLKGRVCNEQARKVELGVIVCAEYSYDKIRPRHCVAEELEDLKEFKIELEQSATARASFTRAFL